MSNQDGSPPVQHRLDEYSRINASRRRVRVKGMAGVDVTVVVTVVQGKVWLSISPPFTWEAIMEPAEVEEVISILQLARDEAKKVATARNGSAFREGKAIVRTITNDGSATQ